MEPGIPDIFEDLPGTAPCKLLLVAILVDVLYLSSSCTVSQNLFFSLAYRGNWIILGFRSFDVVVSTAAREVLLSQKITLYRMKMFELI